MLYVCALCSPLSTSVYMVSVCCSLLSPFPLRFVLFPYLFVYLLLFPQRWHFLYLICGEGYLLYLLLLSLLLSLSFIVVIRGSALCLHFGCLCYLPTQYMAYVCLYRLYIYRHIYSVGKSSHTYCRLGIAGQPQFSWKYAGFICLTVFYAQPTDAQHDRLCVECVCASICVSGVI